MLFGFDHPPVAEDERVRSDLPLENLGRGGRSPWLFGLGGLVVGLLITGGLWAAWPDADQGVRQGDVELAVADALDARADAPSDASIAYAQIAPSLVVVRAISADDSAPVNIGGGVVINDQGHIMTSHHVVVDAKEVELTFADGSVTSAQLESSDTELDIAVLTATSSTRVLEPAVMGNARTLQIGDPVFAVGNPLGLTSSITAGVISGLNRDLPFPARENAADAIGSSTVVLEDLIQFDAAVNQGSSGGPLLNTDGHVIGIVTALVDPAGQSSSAGIGFAVPIDMAAQRAADGPSQ